MHSKLAAALLFWLSASLSWQLLRASEIPVHKGAVTVHSAASNAVDAIRRINGFSPKDMKLSGVDRSYLRVGTGKKYDFTVGLDGNNFDFSLSEEGHWEDVGFAELPPAGGLQGSEGEGEAQSQEPLVRAPVLPTFDLAGPVELWLEDAKNVRLAMPHDVDAGLLNRVIIADGAIVTIKGARQVSLARPLDFQPQSPEGLSLGQQSALLNLSARLRSRARASDQPLVSLRVVGAESLTAAKPAELASPAESARLKVRRLAPGAVEVSTRTGGENKNVKALEQGWAWPFPEVNSTSPRLLTYRSVLASVLGPKALKEGEFELVQAKAEAVAFLQFRFEVERPALPGTDNSTTSGANGTVAVEKQTWEAIVKLEGGKLETLSASPRGPIPSTLSYSYSVATQNGTLAVNPPYLPPQNLMTMDVNWSAYE